MEVGEAGRHSGHLCSTSPGVAVDRVWAKVPQKGPAVERSRTGCVAVQLPRHANDWRLLQCQPRTGLDCWCETDCGRAATRQDPDSRSACTPGLAGRRETRDRTCIIIIARRSAGGFPVTHPSPHPRPAPDASPLLGSPPGSIAFIRQGR